MKIKTSWQGHSVKFHVTLPVVDSQLSLFIVALNSLPLVSLVAPGTLLCSVLLLYGSPVLQCARGSPRFYLLGNPPLAHPWGRDPPSASFISRPFFLACLILSSGFLSPGYSFNTHGSRAASVRGHPDPTPGSVEPATLHLAHRCLQGSTRSRYPSFSPLLRCVPGPKGPPQVKRPRSLTPGHVATSKSFHTASLSLLASLRPQSFLGASPVAQSSTTSPPVRVCLPLGHQNPNGISTPADSLRRQPLLSKASGSPEPAALPVAAAPIPGLPPVFFWGRPYPVSQSPCASAVRDLTWAPQPPPAPLPLPESPLGASRCSVPSAHSPPRFAAPRKAAASAACPDPRTPKSPTGRFSTPGSPQGPTHTRPSPLVHARPPGRLNLLPRPWPRPRSRSCPLCYSGAARIQWHSLRAPQLCAISPGPPPAPPPPPESLLGASRCSVPSAHSPPRLAAPRKAAASAACSDPRTPKSPTGRFGTPGVAAGAHTRSAPSSGLAPQPGPHSARGRHDFDFLLPGPSGAKSSGVRHLRVLGHAPNVTHVSCRQTSC
ncbi:hypothetical protein NDU88_001591 [Pleurodeles waltl]|uniref:Uncharacterized protein n=1 Tax=Pleurodeles waltl TaxID=8319 RepID=A0AAV7WMW5_PLEWA|nr:hypothetical protein NDU88_001591 [Pleurodeles waltl]